MRVAARAYKERKSLLRIVGNLQVTPVFMQEGRYLPEVTISKNDCRVRLSTCSPAVFTKDGHRARPFLPILPGTDGTIGHQGPGVSTGQLGTLFVAVQDIVGLYGKVLRVNNNRTKVQKG